MSSILRKERKYERRRSKSKKDMMKIVSKEQQTRTPWIFIEFEDHKYHYSANYEFIFI